jgi:hypothetical protein
MPDHAEPEVDHARFVALVGAMAKIVRAPDAERRIAEDRAAFLAEVGFDAADVQSLTGATDKRVLLYRKLIRAGLVRAIRAEVPRTAARLEDGFDAWVSRFIDEEAPRSHYLRDVAFEFVAWAKPRWVEDPAVPDYLADLARHELSAFDVASADAAGQSPGAELAQGEQARAGLGVAGAARKGAPGEAPLFDLERAVLFDASVRLYRYDHAVHRLAEGEDERDAPAREPTALLAYRDADHDVRYLELSPLAAAIFERLLRGETLREGVLGGASALGHPLDGAVLASTASLLDDLGERGVVLGGAPA